jgi:two-component system LytT family response regulator
MLKKYPEVNVVGEAENIDTAKVLIQKEVPYSVFLDIKLKNENAFDLVKEIPKTTKVIFVSGYEKYALKAFEIDAFDYIKKPFNTERLDRTVKKLITNFQSNGSTIETAVEQGSLIVNTGNGHNGNGHNGSNPNDNDTANVSTLKIFDENDETVDETEIEHLSRDHNQNKILEYDDRIFITTENISKFLKISEILCIKAEKDYTYIYTICGKKFLVLKSMTEWEERLTPRYFVRIHRSTIVNIENIQKVERWFNYSYQVYIGGIPEPFQMSRRYSVKLKERFK